jgi:para-nitrobenzyl esterase
MSSEKATHIAHKILNALEVSPNDLSKLEAIPVEQLVDAIKSVPLMSLGPVLDGNILPQHPEEAIAKGSAKDISILIGTNKDEFTLFTVFDTTWNDLDENALSALFSHAFGTLWPTITQHFLNDENVSRDLFEKLMTINIFTGPAIKLAEEQVKQGAPVYMYRFDFETPILGGGLKSCHALEIPFVWNSVNKPETSHFTGEAPERLAISNQMHKAWIAFAHNGSPNTKELPDWPKYNLEDRPTMLFNTKSHPVNDPDGESRIKWAKVIEQEKHL